MMLRKAKFEQDGGYFHEIEVKNTPYLTVRYKRETVNDFDLPAAKRARKWFVEEWCPPNGIEPELV